ncbi:MAG TPA: hypothetical protein VF712_04520 [Thermoleophilaceae bacterium]|jgi:hypothetical protein
MRDAVWTVGFHAAFVLPGLALLYALGFVRRLRDVPLAIGPAYLTGVAGVISLLLIPLVLDVGVRLPQLVVASALCTLALAATGFVLARRGRARAEDVPGAASAGSLERWAGRVGFGALAVFFVAGFSAYAELPTVGDDWTIWSYKAVAFFTLDGELRPEVFAGHEPGPAHLHYPVLQPLLESLYFRSVDGAQLQQWHSMLWILFGAFVWTVAWLARTRAVPAFVALAPVAALALTQKSHRIIEIGYADVTVACFAAAGALAIGFWVSRGGARYAVLGSVLLAGAANTKNEGLVAAIAVLVSAAAIVLWSRRDWRATLAAGAIFAAGVVPWILWRSSNHIRSADVAPLGDSLEWDYLSDRFDRVGVSFSALFDHMSNPSEWNFIAPALLVLAGVCLVSGIARREAAFYLAVPTLMVLALVWVYWTGFLGIEYWLENSSDRTVTTVLYVCGVGTLHLTALLMATIHARRRPAETQAPPPG